MKTYLVLFFNSEGADPTDVMHKANSLGFETVVGAHDLVYEWEDEPSDKVILELGNKVKNVLNGTKVMFKLETV